MQRLLMVIGLALVLTTGCKKSGGPGAGGGARAEVSPPAGVVLAPPGPGGAVQTVRGAAVRTNVLAEMHSLQQLIETSWTANGKMPTKEEITRDLQKDAAKIYKMVESNVIVLTGTSNHDHVWAYTTTPHSVAGEFLVVTASSVGRMSKSELDDRLKQQGQ